FDVEPDRISGLVHPQSIIHSMVTVEDGSTNAQLGSPGMKITSQYALSYPDRWPAPHARLDWSHLKQLDFEEPDLEKFRCLRPAYEALEAGGTAPALLNAANEQAVSLFLNGKVRFSAIPALIAAVMSDAEVEPVSDLEQL